MLQTPPSHLSRVCGHSHIKKFWLMQTQNESQACESKNSLLSSSPRPLPFSSFKGPESSQSPQRSSGSPSLRSLLAAASPTGSPVRPLLASAAPLSGGCGSVAAAARHASLATCAESLSPTLLYDHNHGSVRPSSSDTSAGILNQGNYLLDTDELNCSRFKFTVREDDPSPSSSRCGSPVAVSDSHHFGLGLHEGTYHETQSTTEPREASRAVDSYISSYKDDAHGDNDIVSDTQVGADDPHTLLKYNIFDSHSPDFELNEFGTNAGRFDYLKGPVRGASPVSLEERGKVAVNVSTNGSGSCAGDFEYLKSPVRSARTVSLDRKGKATVNGWMSPGPLLKVGPGKGIRSINESSTYHELSPEDSNIVRNTILRTCVLCGTTKTPLWRSGPHGPKSLCNACGIRFKKAKRCPGQYEGSDFLDSPIASPDATKPASRPLKRKQDTSLFCRATSPRESGTGVAAAELRTSQHQKRSRWPQLLVNRDTESHGMEVTGSSGESCLTWNFRYPSSGSPDLCAQTQSELVNMASINEHTTVSRKVAKDEEEAAVLLMYLSCGLVYA